MFIKIFTIILYNIFKKNASVVIDSSFISHKYSSIDNEKKYFSRYSATIMADSTFQMQIFFSVSWI